MAPIKLKIRIPKRHQLQIAVFNRKNYIDSERNYNDLLLKLLELLKLLK